MLGLDDIPVKIDTGAYTSSIHCSQVVEKVVNKRKVLSFHLLGPDSEGYSGAEICATEYSISQVKSSSGHLEERYVIETVIEMFGEEIPIELSLSDRGEMKFPVLLGRKLLRSKFIVDVSLKDLSFKSKKIYSE